MITSIFLAVALGVGTVYGYQLFIELIERLVARITPVGPPKRPADIGCDLPRKDSAR